jgi:alanyl-tRNA synthetase
MFSTNTAILDMESREIRKTFLEFFASKEHEVVPSAPMVIKNDPTLMFTNAGMNQFKDVFLGNAKAPQPRATDSQKCLRVSGKQNDLEEVGVDTYHHTMFEMLGNWSFGDYFKKEAIAWAWELLTEVYKLDKDRLYVTIFEGDENDDTTRDTEAYDIWKGLIAEERILACDKKDNFWEMGDTGPCGPCSEIHIDIRSDEERAALPGLALVNKDHPLVIEIWNLVFMQHNRMADGKLVDLSNQHIDTGMGLERLTMAMQGKKSNYDTDIFAPLISKISEITGITYKQSDEKSCVATRVIADHVRAISFSITDGQLPSNTGAGYVIRRILRRAIRYYYSFLDRKEPFIYELVPVLVAQMGDAFPELKAQQELIVKIIKSEEESFLKTLERGILIFNDYVKSAEIKNLDGQFVFTLYDRFGFPIDLTRLMAEEIGFTLDEDGFKKHLKVQQDTARQASNIDTEDWVQVKEDDLQEFIGYDQLESDVHITRYRKVTAKNKTQYQVVFNVTPFYPEGGGQVGDTGYIEDADGTKTSITNTRKENNLAVHFINELPANPEKRFKAVVNSTKRNLTINNHSATHLLHEALRTVLGTHVEQKGSLVNEKYLRFDFSHFSKVTDEEIATIEKMVNEGIRKNLPLDEHRAIPKDQALEMGAMALFGEKYGDLVRVIKFGSSVELCGGCHVAATGQIGLFKITSEGSVASGIRRVEAITAVRAEEFMNKQFDVLNEVSDMLKNPKDVKKAVSDLIQLNAELTKSVDAFNREKAAGLKDELLKKFTEVNGVNFLAEQISLDPESVKNLAFQLKGQIENAFVVIGSESNGKAQLTVLITDDLVKERDLNAGKIIRELAKEINGGGGGQPFFATAGGKKPEGIPAALKLAQSYI